MEPRGAHVLDVDREKWVYHGKPEGNEKIDDKKGAEVKTHDECQTGGGFNPPPVLWVTFSEQPLLRLHRLSVRK